MLRFYRPGSGSLFQWAGVIQRGSVKGLSQPSTLSEADTRSLIQFCFPTPEPMSGPLCYVFRFKPSDGNFYNVFCLLDQTSFQLRDLDTNQQCCIVMVTLYYDRHLFEEILKAVRSLLLHNLASAQRFLSVLQKSPHEITNIAELSKLFSDAVDYDLSLRGVALFALAKLPLANLGRLVIGLLTDTPIIIISSDLAVLSQFCFSLLALIAPLQWHHLFAPILPLSLLESLCCPTPFIVGLHRLLIPRLTSFEIDGHLLVDLDDGSVLPNGVDALPQYATHLTSILKTGAVAEFHAFIVMLMCGALGVQTANSHRTTVRRIKGALETGTCDTASFAGSLFQSRTLRPLVDAMQRNDLSTQFTRLLAMGNTSGITSPAFQQLDEFPVRQKIRKSDMRRVESMPNVAPNSPILDRVSDDPMSS